MDINSLIKIKSIIFEFLNSSGKSFKSDLSNCSHLDIESGYDTKWHMEDSAFTHTLLVANSLPFVIERLKDKFKFDKQDFIILLFACYLHDIGKPKTRCINNEKGKVTFYGHAEEGTSIAFEYLNVNDESKSTLLNALDISETEFDNMKMDILYLVSCHMKSHDIFRNFSSYSKKKKDIGIDLVKLSNYDIKLFKYMSVMNLCDTMGSFKATTNHKYDIDFNEFSLKMDIINSVDINTVIYNEPSDKTDNNTITLFAGPAAAGKDYYSNKLGYTVLSLDDIRVNEYKKYIKAPSIMNPELASETYDKAFKYCRDNNINVENLLMNHINYFKNRGEYNKLAITATLMTTKSRKRMYNRIYNSINSVKYIDIVFLMADKDILHSRNGMRTSKNLNPFIINKFLNEIHFPTNLERFNKVTYIYNI